MKPIDHLADLCYTIKVCFEKDYKENIITYKVDNILFLNKLYYH
jgi:hypothetical protein